MPANKNVLFAYIMLLSDEKINVPKLFNYCLKKESSQVCGSYLAYAKPLLGIDTSIFSVKLGSSLRL